MADTWRRVTLRAERLKAAVVAALQLKDDRSGGGGIQIIEIIDLIWQYALSTDCTLPVCGAVLWCVVPVPVSVSPLHDHKFSDASSLLALPFAVAIAVVATFLGERRKLESDRKLLHPIGLCRYVTVRALKYAFNRQIEIPALTDGIAICDVANHRIRFYDPASDQVLTLASAGRSRVPFNPGPLLSAGMVLPRGITPHPFLPGALFVAGQICIYLIDPVADELTAFAGSKEGFRDGVRSNSLWSSSIGMTTLRTGPGEKDWTLFVCDTAMHRIRSIDLSVVDGMTYTVARGQTDADPEYERVDKRGVAVSGSTDPNCQFNMPGAMCIARGPKLTEPADTLYFTSTTAIWKLDVTARTVALMPFEVINLVNLTSQKPATVKSIGAISCMRNGIVLITCTTAQCIFAVDLTQQKAVRIAGVVENPGSSDGPALTAAFSFPYGLALSDDESVCWISDFSSSTIRKLILPDYFIFE